MIVCSLAQEIQDQPRRPRIGTRTGIRKRSMKKAANDNTQLVFSSGRRTKVNAVTPDNWPRALPC